ncbi:MAG: AsmA family protein [Pseudomonadota bacterium]
MKILGYTLLGILCLLLAGVTFLVIAAPVDLLRDQAIAAVKRQTGRTLEIRGSTSLAFYPSIGVTLNDVSLSAPPEMARAEPFMDMRSLTLAMPISALLQRALQIDAFVIDQLVVDLHVDARGRRTWDFATDKPADTSPPVGPELAPELQDFVRNSGANNSNEGAAQESATAGLRGLKLGDVRVVDGSVRYRDARKGTDETVSGISVALKLDALDAPLSVEGVAAWRGRTVPLSATVTSLADAIAGRGFALALQSETADASVSLDGRVISSPTSGFAGKLVLEAPQVPQLSRWLGGDSASAGPIRSASLKGDLSATTDSATLRNATFRINDLAGTGALQARLAGRVPFIAADVTVGEIVTRTFLNPPAARPTAATTPSPKSSAGWSNAPLDLSGLKSVDAQFRVAYERLRHDDIVLDGGAMRATLKSGVLNVSANPVRLYGGTAQGTLALDARAPETSYDAKFEVRNVAALPLLKAFAAFDWLSGKTAARIDLAGRGRTQRQLVSTMVGTTSFTFRDGAIEGLNIPKMVRGVRQGQFSNFDRVSGEKTDFSALSASFNIRDGVAQNSDLSLVGPFLRAQGRGQVDIGRRALDYQLNPKVVASLEGQGGGDSSGFAIPLRIKGPWSAPSVAPDLDGVLNDPASAVDAVKNLDTVVEKARKSIKSEKVRGLLDNVLGGGNRNGQGGQSGQAGGAAEPLGGLLGDFLKSQ